MHKFSVGAVGEDNTMPAFLVQPEVTRYENELYRLTHKNTVGSGEVPSGANGSDNGAVPAKAVDQVTKDACAKAVKMKHKFPYDVYSGQDLTDARVSAKIGVALRGRADYTEFELCLAGGVRMRVSARSTYASSRGLKLLIQQYEQNRVMAFGVSSDSLLTGSVKM